MEFSVRINVKSKVSGLEMSNAIVNHVNACGGIVEALKDFKPSSLSNVEWGRQMSKLGYTSVTYSLSGLEPLRDYCASKGLPIGQVLTYLHQRGDMPVVQPRAVLLPKDTNEVLLDSPLTRLIVLRNEIDGIVCQPRDAGLS